MWWPGLRPHPHSCLLLFLRWPFSAACECPVPEVRWGSPSHSARPSASPPSARSPPRPSRGALSAGTGRPGRRHSRPWRRGPPLPALRCAQRGASAATGGCARGGGRPRPFGMLPWRGREAARRDHQPQLVRKLVTRDTKRGEPGPLSRRVAPSTCSCYVPRPRRRLTDAGT